MDLNDCVGVAHVSAGIDASCDSQSWSGTFIVTIKNISQYATRCDAILNNRK